MQTSDMGFVAEADATRDGHAVNRGLLPKMVPPWGLGRLGRARAAVV
ncbi:MAG: hypothetical protein R2932_59860 [Caldilineaceae bacterium]